MTSGHHVPSWDTDLGCSTDFFYLHHRCSCSPGLPRPAPRPPPRSHLVERCDTSLAHPLQSKPTPTPPSGSAPSTLTLPGPELCPYLDGASPQSVRRTSTHRICILKSPHDSQDTEGVTSLGRAPSPLPTLTAQGPGGPRQGRGLQERLRKAPDTQRTVLSQSLPDHCSLPRGGDPPLSHPLTSPTPKIKQNKRLSDSVI